MDSQIFRALRRPLRRALAPLCVAFFAVATAPQALAEPRHGIAMYGEPALPPDFVALPYANPEAPKGGRIVMGEPGGFDSLNPWILAGRAPWGMGLHVAETLMARSIDEPFTLYGLLAESVETDEARTYVEYTLRPEARFSDGSPVTVEDVIWSYETLGTQGHPRYRTAWAKVASIASPAPGKVRITFTQADRELALLMGMRPVLKKAQWEGRDFAQSSLEPPIGSGAYTVGAFEAGRYISFVRDPDWWGRDLPINRGLHNFDELRYEYFLDPGVIFEAFKAGDLTIWRETNAARWQTQFDFPAIASGEVVKAEIPHQRPAGITGLVFNTRRPVFADWRVREALTLAFNFEFINQTMNLGTEPRITSYFANSALAMQPGPATGRVAELLAPYAADLPPGTLEGYAPPVSDGTLRNRANMRRAAQLLEEAGWTAEGGTLRNAQGEPFAFDILLAQGAAEAGQVVDIYVQALAQLGISPRIVSVDSAQYIERTNRFDFDMAWILRTLSLSPGNEQRLYWGAAGVDQPGSRNWMGMASPAADAMIDALLTATDPAEMATAAQALDRVLTAGRWVIPVWYSRATRIAHARDLHYPARLPLYGDWPGFAPDVWWHEE